jgi:class 3 adenylate cyclase
MPLYMDRHDLQAVTPEDVAAAHIKDLEIQEQYGVHYITYWFDASSGTVFCLADAPTKEAAETVHRESHGLIAFEVIEVDGRAVVEFLGRIQEPNPGEPWEATAFRTILFTDMESSTSLTQRLGDAKAIELMRAHDRIVRAALQAHAGSEVDHAGDGIMASFKSVVRAVECAIQIQREVAVYNETATEPFRVRMGISAGEPVTASDRLFGAVIQLAARTCACADGGQIYASAVIRDLCVGKGFAFADRGAFPLKGFEDPVNLYEVHWQPA